MTAEQEFKYRVSEVLYYIWDPIGVNDSGPASRDEYDSYVPEIVESVIGGATAGKVAKILYRIEVKEMALNGRMESCEMVAELIIQWSALLYRKRSS